MGIHRSLVNRAVVLAALASVSAPALAQQAGTAAPAAKNGNGTDNSAENIVVTGSRLVTNGNKSPTQVTVVTADQLEKTTPTNVSDALRKLPQFAASSSQANTQAAGSGAFSASSFLNLRSIGPVRNLVLFDGNRLSPSAPNGAVDIYTIPQMLIQRVDVATGGVSAVYGSDAVSGVVNFIVDKKFNGIKVEASTGLSQRSDDATQKLGIAAGTSFAGGRGHIEGSLEYFNSDGIASNKDRSNGAARWTATGTGTAANPFVLTSDSRLGGLFSFGGHILATYDSGGNFIFPFYDTNFSTNGVLTPFVHGTATGTPGIESGGEGGYYESALLATLRTKQGFLRLDYALGDDINFHAQGAITGTDSVGVYIQPLIVSTFSSTNAFLSPTLQSQMATAGLSTFLLAKFQENEPYVKQATNARNIFANLGFDGKLGPKFDWSVDYAHNESRRIDVIEGNENQAKLAAALDAVVAPGSYSGSDFLTNSAGQKVVCNVTLTNPGLYPGCLPLNVFGPTSEDQNAESWFRGDTRNVLTQKLDTVTATIKGSLFHLPAGDVRVAVNGEYRKLSLVDVSNAQPTDLADCTGLRYNCNATTTLWREAVTANSQGKENVKEIAGEVLVPILADVPFFQSLTFDGAARYTHYSTSGGVATWKAGLDWHLNSDLSFRGNLSRDIRAPTITELFGAQQLARSGYFDIQTNTGGTTTLVTGGNSSLTPEKANTLTLGAVFTPHWLRGFSVAVDYFDIKIKNAIQTIDARDPTYQRQCIDSNYTSPFCALYVRPISASDTTPANYPTEVFANNINVARVHTKGVDVDAIYNAHFLDGNWNFRLLGTYQPTYTTAVLASSPLLNNAGVDGLPKYRVTGFVGYNYQRFGIETQTTWHSSTRHSPDPTIVYAYPNTAAKSFTDLTLTYDVPIGHTGKKNQFFFTVNNLFDTKPAVYPAVIASVPGFGVDATNGDDPIGRYYTIGFRARF